MTAIVNEHDLNVKYNQNLLIEGQAHQLVLAFQFLFLASSFF